MVSRPHGGKLINRIVKGPRKEKFIEEALELPKISIDKTRESDLVNIAHGVYSPLEGFMVQNDYENVVHEMRLENDLPWTIPIILDISEEDKNSIKEGDDIALYSGEQLIALMKVEEIYGWDKKKFAENVYGTLDEKHPGVKKIFSYKDYLVGGTIDLLNEPEEPFYKYRLWPLETRILFKARKWHEIVAFQTRNVPHLGHEYVQKAALTFMDGLFINPLVGWKKPGDFKDEVIIKAYEALIDKYYPKNTVVFSILRMQMRYAGPREAVFHAIVRKNFGATHFIVGRDHAGVGNYYGPYDAWEIFQEFPDLGITPLFIRESFYCKKCGGMVNEKICPHDNEYRIRISGTKLRELLTKKQKPPSYMMREEVAEVVLDFDKPFITG